MKKNKLQTPSRRGEGANQRDAGLKSMIQKLDELWFRLLDRLNLWVLDRLAAHCRRENRRRFRRLMVLADGHHWKN